MRSRLREITVGRGIKIRDAMEAIDRGACEIALVVDGEGRLLGTLTDGDIRRALLKGATLDSSAAAHVNIRFTSVTSDAGRAEVLDLMRARRLDQIPILDDVGRLCGLHLLQEMVGAIQRPNWAVIMAGGRGERLRPLTDSLPKPLVTVAGRPILERILLHLIGFGVRRFFISIHYLGDMIEKHFGDGSAFGCHIEYLRETEPLGTGGSLTLLPERPTSPFLLLNGDQLSQFDVGSMFDTHHNIKALLTVGIHEHFHQIPYGVTHLDGERITRIEEKPEVSWPINAGIYVLEPTLLQRIPTGTMFPITSLIEQCLERGERVAAYRMDDWVDIGQPRELRRARGEE